MTTTQIIGTAVFVVLVVGIVLYAGAATGVEGSEWVAYLGFVFGVTALVVVAALAASGELG